MDRFPIYRSTKQLPGVGTSVRANFNTDTGEGQVWGAIGNAANTIADLGVKWDLMDAKAQLNESSIVANDVINGFYTELSGNNDPNTYGESLNKLYENLDSISPKNPRANSLFKKNISDKKLSIAKDVRGIAEKKLESNVQSSDFLLLQKSKETGDFSDYKSSVITGQKLGVYTAKEAESLIDSANKDAEILVEKRLVYDKEQLELKQESDRDGLGQALEDGTIDYGMINNTSLDEKEQDSYRIKMENEVTRRGTEKPIVTNQLIAGDLEADAYKIWMGAVNVKDFNKSLSRARYGDLIDGKFQYEFKGVLSDTPFIDDTTYSSLRSLATKELKQSQAKGLSDASYYAKGQLVKIPDDKDVFALIADFTKQQKENVLNERQIQLENWTQFNRSMKLWQTENPDATESDYYIESHKKLPLYMNREESDITGVKVLSEKEKRRQRYLELKAKASK